MNRSSLPSGDPVIRRAYASTEWQAARRRHIRKHPLCEDCAETGEYVPGDEVHHIYPLRDGGSLLHPRNLRHLCRRCHSRYEAREKMWRAGMPGAYGADLDGNPIDSPGGVRREDNSGETALWKMWAKREDRKHGRA